MVGMWERAQPLFLAALEMREVMARHGRQRVKVRLEPWQMRIGINTGPVIGGIVGQSKIAFDVWGNTVNIASRMETNDVAGSVTMRPEAWLRVAGLCECESLGHIPVRGKHDIEIFRFTGWKIPPEDIPEAAKDMTGAASVLAA